MCMRKFLSGHAGMTFIFCALPYACHSSDLPSNIQLPSASEPRYSSSVSSTTPTASTAMPQQGSFLKKNMAYSDARKALLAQGWAPERDMDCKANMGADDAAKCDAMPELSIYSDQGVLVVHFRHGPQRLTISSYGMFSDWKVSGENSRLRVTDWKISNATTEGNPATP